ncbi:MAG: response regulator transcription factor [Vicinamibacterales bacterium]
MTTAISAKSILLIDDDLDLCELMKRFFHDHGFVLSAAHDGPSGLDAARTGAFDLVLLDGMLPGLDGFDVLRELRAVSDRPVLMLTARADQPNRLQGLRAGADDYVTKPFDPDELVERVRAVLRRASGLPRPEEPIDVTGVSLDPGTRQVRQHGRTVEVTSIEFDILHALMRSAGRIVSRDDLMQRLYNRPATAFDRAIDVHIHHLRRKLRRRTDLIRTVRGVGYLFSREPTEEAKP